MCTKPIVVADEDFDHARGPYNTAAGWVVRSRREDPGVVCHVVVQQRHGDIDIVLVDRKLNGWIRRLQTNVVYARIGRI